MAEIPAPAAAEHTMRDRIVARITQHSAKALQLAPKLQVFAIIKAVTFDKGNVPQAASHGWE